MQWALKHALACGAPPTAAVIVLGIWLAEPRRPEYAARLRTAGAPVATAGQHLPLEVRPNPVSLGRFAQGQAVKCEFRVVNPGSEMVRIERVQLSCTCLEVGPMPVRVEPGEENVLAVRYDPSEDPEFRGRLSVELSGLDALGRAVFRTHAELEVTPGSMSSPRRCNSPAGATGGREVL
jgi:Protein of unknown function (DUF1573)